MAGKHSDTKALFDEFNGTLFQYFYRMTGGNIQAARDCVGEVFLRLGQRLTDPLAPIDDPPTELHRLAREVAEHRQKRRPMSRHAPHPLQDLDTTEMAGDPMAKVLADKVVKWARLNLPAEQLVAFLAWIHGDTPTRFDPHLRRAFQVLQHVFGDQVLALHPGQFGHNPKLSPQ